MQEKDAKMACELRSSANYDPYADASMFGLANRGRSSEIVKRRSNSVSRPFRVTIREFYLYDGTFPGQKMVNVTDDVQMNQMSTVEDQFRSIHLISMSTKKGP